MSSDLLIGGSLVDVAKATAAQRTLIADALKQPRPEVVEVGGGRYILNGTSFTVDPTAALGKGGEADVYRYGTGKALKLFKLPDHPDIAMLPPGAEKDRMVRDALRRIETHQRKLLEFPKGLPRGLIGPEELAMDRSGRIRGYAMSLVPNAAELLELFRDKALRNKVEPASVVKLFLRLWDLVQAIHAAGIVIGDFNDLNVLVQNIGTEDMQPFAIDADSMQFGTYLCPMFTTRFVDPLLCDPSLDRPMLTKPHNEASDWFAFQVMLFQSLLWVSPYGGIHDPKSPKDRVADDARSMRRVSVLGDSIIYPKPARKKDLLPDELLHHFLQVFEKDKRGNLPRALLETIRWTKCTDCGAQHARGSCPRCGVAAPAVNMVVTVSGRVTTTRSFPTPRTRGNILQVAFQGGSLRYVYEDNGRIYREDGTLVLGIASRAGMRFRISGSRTMVGLDERIVVVEAGKEPQQVTADPFGRKPMFDTNADHLFRLDGGNLVRDTKFGVDTTELIGTVLRGQTTFWVGPEFGFGFYRAGALFQAFTFTASKRSFNDHVDLPAIPGQLVDAFAVFSSNRVWFFTTSQHLGKMLNRCTVITSDGKIVGTHEATSGDGSWLSEIRGHCAATLPKGSDLVHTLFVPTDRGIVRVDAGTGGLSQTQSFPDTEPFVDSSSRLFLAREGIYVVRSNEVTLLQMK